MRNSSKYYIPLSSFKALSVCSAFLFWALIVSTGMRLPYIHTDFSWMVRLLLLFPLLLAVFGFFAFYYKKPHQETGYRQRMRQLATRKERTKETLLGLLAGIGIAAGLAWTSVAFSAWMTNLFATEHYAKNFHVAAVTIHGGGKKKFDLELVNENFASSVTLRLTRARYKQFQWKAGDLICIRGRKSIFGIIIDSEAKTNCRQRMH